MGVRQRNIFSQEWGMSEIEVKNLREKEKKIVNKLFEKDLEIQKQMLDVIEN